MAKAEYVLYVDDSGTKEYPKKGVEFASNALGGCTRYFAWGGVLMTLADSMKLAENIVSRKRSTFGTSDVEIKSNWLRMPHERKRRYLDKYDISEAELNLYVDDYYRLLESSNLRLIAVVVDKQHMRDKYQNPYPPHTVAYECLLQRVQQQLHHSAICHVKIDSFDGGTSAGKSYRKLLEDRHVDLLNNGSQLLNGSRPLRKMTFPSIAKTLKFKDSAKSHLIQVADISAYNVYRQFVDYGEEWETRGIAKLPQYDHFGRLLSKYRTGPNGRLQGYGVVKFPIKHEQKVEWVLPPYL